MSHMTASMSCTTRPGFQLMLAAKYVARMTRRVTPEVWRGPYLCPRRRIQARPGCAHETDADVDGEDSSTVQAPQPTSPLPRLGWLLTLSIPIPIPLPMGLPKLPLPKLPDMPMPEWSDVHVPTYVFNV